MAKVFIPYDYDGDLPENFYDIILEEDENGWYIEGEDANENGIADFVDAYNGDPDVVGRPSWEQIGG